MADERWAYFCDICKMMMDMSEALTGECQDTPPLQDCPLAAFARDARRKEKANTK